MTKTILLAYSGGLDTSWCIPWIRENLDANVITLNVDVGGISEEEKEAMAASSAKLGAIEHLSLDCRQAYFDEIVKYLIMANALRGQLYPLCVGAERSLQAREVAKFAKQRGITTVAHGCTAAGNDQVRFEMALRAAMPDLEVLAPIRDTAPTRAEEVAFLDERGFVAPLGSGDYSINTGLWGVTIGGVETTGSSQSIPENAWVRTLGAFDQPLAAKSLSIQFEAGLPVALDGKELASVQLIEKLDEIAASYGIGRGIHLGDTILGTKGRVAFEAPAAAVLIAAHRELEKLVLSAEQLALLTLLSQQYSRLVHQGQFMDPAARDIEAALQSSQTRVSGEVFLTLRPGSVFVDGSSSAYSLYAASAGVYGEEIADWSAADAKGYCRIKAVPGVLHEKALQQATSLLAQGGEGAKSAPAADALSAESQS